MAMESPRRTSRFLFLFGGILLLGGIVFILLTLNLSGAYDTGVFAALGWLLTPVGLFALVLAQVRRSQGK
jgi:hypothetical protein